MSTPPRRHPRPVGGPTDGPQGPSGESPSPMEKLAEAGRKAAEALLGLAAEMNRSDR